MILTGHGHSLAAIHQENIPCLSISNFQSWCTREKQEIPDINPYFLIVTAASEAYPKYFVWVQLFEPPTATQHGTIAHWPRYGRRDPKMYVSYQSTTSAPISHNPKKPQLARPFFCKAMQILSSRFSASMQAYNQVATWQVRVHY